MNEPTIRCAGCGNEGKPGQGFQSKGHDPFLGRLCYHCASCGRDLFVDPMEALASSTVQGVPVRRGHQRSRQWRCLNSLLGLFCIGLVLVLVVGLSPHWWAYIAAAVILVMVWQCAEPSEEKGIGYRV